VKGTVYNNNVLAGYLEKDNTGNYIFTYEDLYLANKENPSISLTLSRMQKEHRSEKLFSFFYGLLSEGINKEIQCRLLKIDEKDDFTRLLQTSGDDTIGAITVKQME
jgi:HipA-like protein